MTETEMEGQAWRGGRQPGLAGGHGVPKCSSLGPYRARARVQGGHVVGVSHTPGSRPSGFTDVTCLVSLCPSSCG